MTEVQGCRLSKGQTFSHRDIIILRVKEEANLRGLSVRTEISDNRQVVCWSREAVDFYVHATQSLTHAFRVDTCVVRPTDSDPGWTVDW